MDLSDRTSVVGARDSMVQERRLSDGITSLACLKLYEYLAFRGQIDPVSANVILLTRLKKTPDSGELC